MCPLREAARTSSPSRLSREAAHESDAKRPPCETVRTSGPARLSREAARGRDAMCPLRKRRAGET